MMINRNRNKEELARLRSYRDPDDEDPLEPDPHEDDVRWFGIWVAEKILIRTGFVILGALILLVFVRYQFADNIPWWPSRPGHWAQWAFTGGILLMSLVSFSMFAATTQKYRQEIRELDARMARRDDATEEEVDEYVRKSEGRLNRRMWLRSALFMVATVILFPIFGTTLILPWGNILTFAGAMALFFGCVYVWSFRREALMERLRRLF